MEPAKLNIPQEKLIPNNQIIQGRFLGQGGYGNVYEAKWNRDTVAIKRLNLEKMNQQAQAEFERESTLHMKLSQGIDMEKTTLAEQAAESQRKSDRFGWND